MTTLVPNAIRQKSSMTLFDGNMITLEPNVINLERALLIIQLLVVLDRLVEFDQRSTARRMH